MAALVEMRGVERTYVMGDNLVHALRGVDLTIEAGSSIAIMGTSGSGKSTMMNIMGCLDQPTRGSYLLNGKDVARLSRTQLADVRGRMIGFVFQSFNLLSRTSALENVEMPLMYQGIPGRERHRRALRALEAVNLADRADHHSSQLSGGQQQRVAIARALVYNPPVILMDEPLSNLDAKLREEARAWLRELILKMRLSALVVTHDQNEAMAMSDRILLLNNGVIEQQGTPQELYGQPRTLFVADFMGSNNRVAGRIVERRGNSALLGGDGWRIWGESRASGAAAGSEATGMIRLERVRLADGPGDNAIKLPLVTSMFLGDRWEYLFHQGDLRLRAYGARPLPPGEQWLEIPAESFWIF